MINYYTKEIIDKDEVKRQSWVMIKLNTSCILRSEPAPIQIRGERTITSQRTVGVIVFSSRSTL